MNQTPFKINTEFDNKIQVNFVNKSTNQDPCYKNAFNSGFDLRAWITDEESDGIDDECNNYIELKSLDRKLIHTGIYVELPNFVEGQVRPRSGSLNTGITVYNTPGTVDSDYRGEVCIIAANLTRETIRITNSQRIAQFVIVPVFNGNFIKLVKTDNIDDNTERGVNGFGSTGKF